MSENPIARQENSISDGAPIECFKFTHGNMSYLYTSAADDVELEIIEGGKRRTEKYFAEVISRENIRPGSAGSIESCTIKVSKDHAVAKLFEGPPPEIPVDCKVYRLHADDLSKFICILSARIGQVHFTESECELTADMDAWMKKELPCGMNQYYCNHTIFDHNCKLKREDWQVKAFVDEVEGLRVQSSKFAEYPDGYFTGGRIYYGEHVRQITQHKGKYAWMKYPAPHTPRNEVVVVPGCDSLFRTCAMRFKNTVHFSGVPYAPPTDPEKNPTGTGAYWINSLVVQRDTNGFVGTIKI